jgi:hypothetical protein
MSIDISNGIDRLFCSGWVTTAGKAFSGLFRNNNLKNSDCRN